MEDHNILFFSTLPYGSENKDRKNKMWVVGI